MHAPMHLDVWLSHKPVIDYIRLSCGRQVHLWDQGTPKRISAHLVPEGIHLHSKAR
jgi:hypothetical protein